jgi:hypothetical protein
MEELEAQHAAACKALEAASVATAAAQDAFDADGSDTSARALAKTRDAEQLAAEHHARAQRLLDDARAKAAAELKAQREARRATLIGFLAGLEVYTARQKAAEEITAIVRECAARIVAVPTPEQSVRDAEREIWALEAALGIGIDQALYPDSRAHETAAIFMAHEMLAKIGGDSLEQRITAAFASGLRGVTR